MIKPRALKAGGVLGVFTPSAPAYTANPGLFENGVRNLERMGFRVKLGALTEARSSQGYRSGSPEARAREFMDLILDPEVDGLISTIGGANSSSMIPFLDFDEIRRARKPICGFSDVTSLHLAILKFSGLRTFYGPSVMCWFGDWPDGIPESSAWFLEALANHRAGEREVRAPAGWSNHARRWDNGDWQKIPREWKRNEGWKMLSAGEVEAPVLAANFNTLLTAAGTRYWPDLKGRILLLEDMSAPMTHTERALSQLKLMGAFDEISGLIFGKPEFFSGDGAPFGYEGIVSEVVGPRAYPVVTNFDCSHCVPMITVPQLAPVRLKASDTGVEFTFLDGAIE